ncbi:MAG: hypothetical protein ACREGF_01395 [Candidatus Saccharimonadales bacterium]
MLDVKLDQAAWLIRGKVFGFTQTAKLMAASRVALGFDGRRKEQVVAGDNPANSGGADAVAIVPL